MTLVAFCIYPSFVKVNKKKGTLVGGYNLNNLSIYNSIIYCNYFQYNLKNEI